MTGREFDPIFSAALRNQLEALAGGAEQARATSVRPALLRPQLWVTVITALVVLAATIGVLRVTAPPPQPAAPGTDLVDPLTHVIDPSSAMYVSRAPLTLLDVRGEGAGTRDFQVPAGVRGISLYLDCGPAGTYRTDLDHDGASKGDCSRDSGTSIGVPLKRGAHTVTVTVAARTAYALLIIAAPAPTISAGPLIDPLAQVRDLRNPDALTGDATPLLQLSGSAGVEQRSFSAPTGKRLRVFLACRPSSPATSAVIDGHTVSGCMNAIAHWFDFTPKSATVSVQVSGDTGGDWALLVVPAPAEATDSPANALLPYPAEEQVVGRARGAGAPVSGRMSSLVKSLSVAITCRGTGWVQIATSDGSSNGRGARCGPGLPKTSGYGNEGDGMQKLGRMGYTVTPHGDVSWTVTFSDGD